MEAIGVVQPNRRLDTMLKALLIINSLLFAIVRTGNFRRIATGLVVIGLVFLQASSNVSAEQEWAEKIQRFEESRSREEGARIVEPDVLWMLQIEHINERHKAQTALVITSSLKEEKYKSQSISVLNSYVQMALDSLVKKGMVLRYRPDPLASYHIYYYPKYPALSKGRELARKIMTEMATDPDVYVPEAEQLFHSSFRPTTQSKKNLLKAVEKQKIIEYLLLDGRERSYRLLNCDLSMKSYKAEVKTNSAIPLPWALSAPPNEWELREVRENVIDSMSMFLWFSFTMSDKLADEVANYLYQYPICGLEESAIEEEMVDEVLQRETIPCFTHTWCRLR